MSRRTKRKASRKDALPKIEQHGSRFRFYYRDAEGKRQRVSEATYEAADAKRTEIANKLKTGQPVIAPDKMTFATWVPQYLALVEAKRTKARTAENYGHKLKYPIAAFGQKALQQITATDIDNMLAGLKGEISESTRHNIRTITKQCLAAAVRKKMIARNPADDAESVDVDKAEVGDTLPKDAFAKFLEGFKGHVLESIVTVALRTGARRNEILAIRHSDVDPKAGTLTIARAVEGTKKHGVRFATPKNGKGRTFVIDADLLALFKREREALARAVAGVPDGAPDVDLSLVKIPDDALVFWGIGRSGPPNYAKPRDGSDISKQFRAKADALGYPKLRFHDLRGSHETALLDSGVPVHVVAARCGHSPAMLLSTYAKRTQKADTAAADAMANIFGGK